MALPASGPISSSQIATELVVSSASFSANSAELLVYTDLNALSISSSGKILNIDTPNSMSEWYNYTHNFKVSGSKVSSSAGLLIPSTASYNFTTFAQFEMSTSTALFKFSGSNFIARGAVSTASVPYSLYYGTYSLAMSSNKQLLQTGVLTAASPSLTYNYKYVATSGSIITLLFKSATTSSAVTVPTPYVKYDQFSSSISNVGIWTNLGTGGATFNLKAFNPTAAISSSGTGTGSYISLNTGSTTNQYLSSSGFDIGGAKDYSFTIVVRPHKWFTNPTTQEGFIIANQESTYTGFFTSTYSSAGTSGSGTATFNFVSVQGGAVIATYYDQYNNANLNNFYHFTYTYNNAASSSQLYLNTNLLGTFPSQPPLSSMTGTKKLGAGADIYFGSTPRNNAGVHLATFSFWTGSILTAGQITALNNEYKSRYTLA
jgi:hypothetical protein